MFHLQGIGADVQVVVHEGEGVVGLLRLRPAGAGAACRLHLLVRDVVELHGAAGDDPLQLKERGR